MTPLTNQSRFCYNYKRPELKQLCCPSIVCASSDYLDSIANTDPIIYGQTQTTQRSFLLAKEKTIQQDAQHKLNEIKIKNTIENAAAISSQIYAQLLQENQQRFAQYRPYIPPVTPVSVTQLQMATANVGVPMSFFTMADCKGSQFITK